ncbi:MAG: hypothetical protein NT118_00460 [Lentisphaerae bacterium]|nr:hypothetical protein [Lentisphaerota bacterium]
MPYLNMKTNYLNTGYGPQFMPVDIGHKDFTSIIKSRGAFCEFYEEQVRYAFRLIAYGQENDFLPDSWSKGMKTNFKVS